LYRLDEAEYIQNALADLNLGELFDIPQAQAMSSASNRHFPKMADDLTASD
jgi:hypothetical protein